MNEREKLVPKRRFKEFKNTGTWEQRKLGDLGQIMTGTTPPTNAVDNYSEDGMIWVTPTDIIKNVTTDTAKKLSKKGESVARVVPPGTILITCIASIGKNTMVSTFVSFNQQINSLTPNSENDSYFLLTQSEIWSQKMKQIASSGTMQIVNKSEFSKLEVNVPSLEEQFKIGTFFKQIDDTIALHQHKLDKTKALKSAYLSDMFPAEGDRTPKRRFAGFTDDWKQRELGDIADVIDPHPSHRAPEKKTVGIPFVGIGDVDEEGNINYSSVRIVDETIYDEHYKRYDLKKKSIGIGRVASLGKIIRLRNDVGKYAISPTMAIIQFDIGVKVDYMYSYMNTPIFQKQFASYSSGSTRQSVGIQDLRKLVFYTPVNVKEQELIGVFFQNLDHSIALHQQKLEKLLDIKKAYLNEMFI